MTCAAVHGWQSFSVTSSLQHTGLIDRNDNWDNTTSVALARFLNVFRGNKQPLLTAKEAATLSMANIFAFKHVSHQHKQYTRVDVAKVGDSRHQERERRLSHAAGIRDNIGRPSAACWG